MSFIDLTAFFFPCVLFYIIHVFLSYLLQSTRPLQKLVLLKTPPSSYAKVLPTPKWLPISENTEFGYWRGGKKLLQCPFLSAQKRLCVLEANIIQSCVKTNVKKEGGFSTRLEYLGLPYSQRRDCLCQTGGCSRQNHVSKTGGWVTLWHCFLAI